jgi:hypothetical protein
MQSKSRTYDPVKSRVPCKYWCGEVQNGIFEASLARGYFPGYFV